MPDIEREPPRGTGDCRSVEGMVGLFVVVGLIVPGVIVFLAVQAYTLYSLFERLFVRGRSAGDLATFPVPGEARVTLPVGKVKLRYQESYRAWSGGEPGVGIDFDVPASLQVRVTSPRRRAA